MELIFSYLAVCIALSLAEIAESQEKPAIIQSETNMDYYNETIPATHRLSYDLLRTYNKNVRPTKFTGDITYVFVELSLFDILKMDTKEQKMNTNCELILKWMDDHLKWQPKDYDGVEYLRIPSKDIWLPDIILYNTAGADYESSVLNTNVIIHYSGKVELVSHSIYSTICNADIQWYPFDQQTCPMVFGSWSYDIEMIQLVIGPADISKYHTNPEFYLENFYPQKEDVFNPCCKNPMSIVTYYIQIQRRTKFSFFFFLMPGILINLCAVMVFSLPAESGEKIGLGINSLLAMIVFLMTMTDNLPPTEKIPLAGLYYGICLSLITVNIVFSVLVLNINVSGERRRPVPQYVKTATLFAVQFLGNRIPNTVRERWNLDENNQLPTTTRIMKIQPLPSKIAQYPNKIEQANEQKLEAQRTVEVLTDPFQKRAVAALETMAKISTKKHQNRLQTEEKDHLSIEWKFISRVVDRFLFASFFIITFILDLAILTSSPFGEKFEYCPMGFHMCDDMSEPEIMVLARQMAEKVAQDHA